MPAMLAGKSQVISEASRTVHATYSSSNKVTQNTSLYVTISEKLISNYLQQANSVVPYTRPVPEPQSEISQLTSPPLFRHKEAVRNIVHGMQSGNLNTANL